MICIVKCWKNGVPTAFLSIIVTLWCSVIVGAIKWFWFIKDKKLKAAVNVLGATCSASCQKWTVLKIDLSLEPLMKTKHLLYSSSVHLREARRNSPMDLFDCFFLEVTFCWFVFPGLTNFYSEMNRGIAASHRIWQLIDRKPLIGMSTFCFRQMSGCKHISLFRIEEGKKQKRKNVFSKTKFSHTLVV